MAEQSTGLSPAEIEAFARGLWYLATIDGEASAQETDLIREFLRDAGSTLAWDQVTAGDFSPLETANLLETTYLRRIFMKAAVALVWADNVYTDNERQALGEFADVFEMSNAEFGELEQAGKRVDLSGGAS